MYKIEFVSVVISVLKMKPNLFAHAQCTLKKIRHEILKTTHTEPNVCHTNLPAFFMKIPAGRNYLNLYRNFG